MCRFHASAEFMNQNKYIANHHHHHHHLCPGSNQGRDSNSLPPLISILCHVTPQPPTFHIVSHHLIPRQFRSTPPNLTYHPQCSDSLHHIILIHSHYMSKPP